jgi:hypothetical protein
MRDGMIMHLVVRTGSGKGRAAILPFGVTAAVVIGRSD